MNVGNDAYCQRKSSPLRVPSKLLKPWKQWNAELRICKGPVAYTNYERHSITVPESQKAAPARQTEARRLEVRPVLSATSSVTIEQLRSIFSTHGLPKVLVTDNRTSFTSVEFHNRTSFTSVEFQEFMKNNGIHRVKSAPYHPASNGLAEIAVQIFKGSMKKCLPDNLNTQLVRFLFRYRITPHLTTGFAPAELLRRRKGRLDSVY